MANQNKEAMKDIGVLTASTVGIGIMLFMTIKAIVVSYPDISISSGVAYALMMLVMTPYLIWSIYPLWRKFLSNPNKINKKVE